MKFLTQGKDRGALSAFTMFFSFFLVAIGIILGAVLEFFERRRIVARWPKILPRLATRLKERTV